MNHHKIKVEKTAHYYTLGEPSAATRYFWFVTHGYGQLASNIIRKFENLDKTEHFIVAPEALNRFYWDMRKGIVGANWMTKQDRLDDIEDYTRFLTQVFEHFRNKLPDNVKIILLGFSQGCATQLRWLLSKSADTEGGALLPHFHQLILWGGLLPEDIDYQPFKGYFQDKKISFVCGDKDEFINAEKINWHLDFAKNQGLMMNYVPFEGKHEILTEVLESFIEY